MFTDWQIQLSGSQAQFTLIHGEGQIMLSGPRLPWHNPTKEAPAGMHAFRVLDCNPVGRLRLLRESFGTIKFDSKAREFVYLGDADLVRIRLAAS